MSGEYSAPDIGGVVGMLRQGGYFPLEISQVSADLTRVTKKKVKIKPLAAFCSQMAAMLRAGVPISKTLEILKDQTEDKALRMIIGDVFGKVQRGSGLSDSFKPYADNFPIILLNMIEAGETSGSLDACLERAGVSFTRTAKLNGKLRSAMVYPAVLLTALIGMIVLMLAFVIPSFSDLYGSNSAELPALTKALLSLSNAFTSYWYVIVFVVFVLVFGFRTWLRSKKGRAAFDKFKLDIPVVGKLLLKVYASRYARTLSSLTSAGVPLTDALSVTARSVINRHIENGLYKAVDAVSSGEELSASLELMGTFPPMVIYMTKLGEESGTMDSLLEQAADFYDTESENAMQTITALLEPGMIILMAVIIVPVLFAVILPVFNMYNMIQ